LNDPTSSPFLFGILLDLFCSLLYAFCVTVNLLYAPNAPKWVTAAFAFCMVVFALAARMKWSVRRKALRERRRRRRRESVEGNEAERLANEEESVEQKREGFEERLGEMREVQNVEV